MTTTDIAVGSLPSWAIWGPVLAAATVYGVAAAMDRHRAVARAAGGFLLLATAAIAAIQVLALVLR